MCKALGGLHCSESISYISKSLWEQPASLFITAKAAYNRYGIRFLPLSSLIIHCLKLQPRRGAPEPSGGAGGWPAPQIPRPGAVLPSPRAKLHPGEPLTCSLGIGRYLIRPGSFHPGTRVTQ